MSQIKKLPLLITLFCLAVLSAILIFVPGSRISAKTKATANKPTSAVPNTTPAPANEPSNATPITAPPGTILYAVKRGDTVPGLVHKYLWDSTYMTASEFETAIRERNDGLKGTFLKPGQSLIIPGMEGLPATEASVSVPSTFEVKAVYLTGLMAGSEKGINIVREWKKVGGNAVVFDIKDSDGSLSIDFDHPLAPAGHRPPIRNLVKYTHWLHSMNMHAIARIAIFRDEDLVVRHPELAVQSRKTGQPWRENGKLVWTDPSNPKVQDYDIALARYAATHGADEIQFDYVRFPAEGDQKDAKFSFETTHPQWKRTDVITDFLSKAYAQIHPTGVLLSLDVFGVMAWQRNVDLAHTGQDIPNMAKNCDVLSPMIYPSHFFGMDGYKDPGDAPEHFIGESMDRFKKVTADTHVVLRPWLQAFGWRTKTYSPEYIRTQVGVAKQRGGIGFLFWNARNDYSKPYLAMPEMAKEPAKFFQVAEPKPVSTPGATPSAPAAADKVG